LRKWISVILVAALTISLWYVASVTYDPMYGAVDGDVVDLEETDIANDLKTLTLWYTDEALTEYLNSVSLSFQKDFGIKVNVVLKSGIEYLEEINKVSIADEASRQEAMPDLYLTSHDNLLRAYLSGLASPVTDPGYIMSDSTYPNVALDAVTCYNQFVGYPLYYETAYFLYNKTYMASIAQNKIESDSDAIEGQIATEEAEKGNIDKSKGELETQENSEAGKSEDDGSENGQENSDGQEDNQSDEENQNSLLDENADDEAMGQEDAEVSQEVLEQLATMIPSTLDDITTFANNYDAPEAVESVFKWDVKDIFYNYFFVGNYMNVGGKAGDNTAVFSIYNQQTVDCLTAYQGMNQFFSIDTKKDNYDTILQDFIDGKLVFTVATTDAIAKLHEAKANGNFQFEYGVTTLPDVSSLLKSRGLSVTDAIAINGYSKKNSEANILATYLVSTKADELYRKAGKVACNKNVIYEDTEISNVIAEYEKSVPLPKMVEAANYWVQLEIAFIKVWDGADPDTTLKELSDTIGGQIEEISANLPVQESFSAGGASFVH